jgi:hypothetical protein
MIGVVFMVSGIVPTSAWSHNCGMHVIADYLIEKIQQDDFEAIFNTPPYPELLKAFQTIYKQENLTWVQIRQASLEASRTDSQIIWGVALRKMLPDVFRRADEYKINLENQFVALMELVKQGLIEEAEESYPIIFEANRDYLEQQARVAHSSSESETEDLSDSISHYWLEKGYENYCQALTWVRKESGCYFWLGMDELTVICQFLGLSAEFDGYQPTIQSAQEKILFSNSTEEHWERKLDSPMTLETESRYYVSKFYNKYLLPGLDSVQRSTPLIGRIYFSEEYLGLEQVTVVDEQKNDKVLSVQVPVVEKKVSFSFALNSSFDFAKKNPNNKDTYLKYQTTLLLNVECPEKILLSSDDLKVVNAAIEASLNDWLHNVVHFFNKHNIGEGLSDNNISILEILAKHACEAILSDNALKLTTCLVSDNRCLLFPGKYNPGHYALKYEKYDFLKTVVIDFVLNNYPGAENSPESKLYIETVLAHLVGPVKDQYDRSFDFRMDRTRYLSELEKELSETKTWAARLRVRGKIAKFYMGEINIKLVDQHHEKSKHNAKIQAKRISRWGYPLMLALRSAGEIANGGALRFGLEMVRPLIPNFVQLPFTYVGGKVASYVGNKLGYESAYVEEYTKLAIGNLISFTLMPQYYIASTVLGGVVYYTFKDSGYDNLEAVCLLASERISLGATNYQSEHKQIKTGDAYQYQLNKNLTPVIGEYAASYISPVVTFVDKSNQQFDKFLAGNAIAIGENLSQDFSRSAIKSISNAIGDVVSQPVQLIQQLQNFNNSWIERGFDFIEGNVLHYLMNDSNFKNERLHAFQLSHTDRLQQSYFGLKKQGEEKTIVLNEINSSLNKEQAILTELQNNPNTPDEVIQQQKLVVKGLQEQFNSQQLDLNKLNNNIASQLDIVNKAIDLSEALYEKTEGFAYQEKYKDAYFAYKYSLAKPNRNVKETEKLLKETEQALLDSQFYNTNRVNQTVEAWAKSVDDLFVRYQANFPDWSNPAHVIGSIVNQGFNSISDRNQLAKFLADEIIRLKHPLYPDVGDKSEIEAERDLLVHEISTDELSGFKRNAHRSKGRLYDYFFAKITGSEKKRHFHRWERIIKPVVNEILYKSVGYKPFKEFNGGDDGEAGQVGLQFNFNFDGSKNVQLMAKEIPIATLYDSEKPPLRLAPPERPAITADSNQVPASSIEGSMIHNPTALSDTKHETEGGNGYSSLNADNPYVQDYLAEQHAELCKNIEHLGEEQERNSKEKPANPEVAEAEADLPGTPKAVVFSRTAQKSSGSKAWSQTHDRLIGNPQPTFNLGGPRAPVEVSPDWLATLTPQMENSRIPVAQLPGLVWDALKESGRDLYDGTVSLSQFTNREMMHFLRGEPLETVQAAALMVQFIGEEKTRLVLGQELKTVETVKQMASNFDNLSKEEKFKAGIKLYLLLVTPPVGLAKTAGTIGRVSDKAVSAIRKTGKTPRPLPTAPLRVNPPRAAKNSLGEPTAHRFMPASGISKSFTPQYGTLNPNNMPNWQQFARSAEELADAPFAPGSIGAGKVWSVKGRLKAAQLPIEGKIRYVPPEYYKASNTLPKGERNGYLDRFQNEWTKGPSRTVGEPFEWDVQLSSLGKNKLGWASRDGRHVNISLKGRITHD